MENTPEYANMGFCQWIGELAMQLRFSLAVLAAISAAPCAMAEENDMLSYPKGREPVVSQEEFAPAEEGVETETASAPPVRKEHPIPATPAGWDSLTTGETNGGGILSSNGGTMLGDRFKGFNTNMQVPAYQPVNSGYAPISPGFGTSGINSGILQNSLAGFPMNGITVGADGEVTNDRDRLLLANYFAGMLQQIMTNNAPGTIFSSNNTGVGISHPVGGAVRGAALNTGFSRQPVQGVARSAPCVNGGPAAGLVTAQGQVIPACR